MKHRIIKTGMACLTTLMNHCALIMLPILMLGLFQSEKSYIGIWIGLIIVPFALQLVRKYIHNFFLFFALHLIFLAGAIVLPTPILLRAVMTGLVLIYIIWSISTRVKEDVREVEIILPIVAVLLIGAVAMVDKLFSKRGWDSCYLGAILVYLVCYFIYYFLRQYMHFLKVNESSAANIPEQEIFGSGMKQTLFFTLGGLLLMILTANIEWFGYIMSWIGKGIVAILRFLLSGERSFQPEEVVEEAIVQGESTPNMGMFGDPGNPFLLWVILEKILLVVIPLAIVAAIIFGLVKGFQYLWSHFHIEYSAEEQHLDSRKDIRESCAIESTKKESTSRFGFLNNRQKIRKIYRKQIIKNKNNIIGDHNPEILERMTAKECCDILSADRLQLIYEKARYSNAEITSEDVKAVKTAGR